MKIRIITFIMAWVMGSTVPITFVPASDTAISESESGYENLLRGDFSYFSGVWANGEGRFFTLNKYGEAIDSAGKCYPGEVDFNGSFYRWAENGPPPDYGGFAIELYPVGVPDSWELGSDTTVVRILAGQSVPSSPSELYLLTEPHSITASNQRSDAKLEDVIVGEWSYVRATDENYATDFLFDEFYFGTRRQGVDVRFDADGKFYQREWYNDTGYSTSSDEPEWILEGTYTIDGVKISFALDDGAGGALFWTECGEYRPAMEALEYQTKYEDTGESVFLFLEKKPESSY